MDTGIFGIGVWELALVFILLLVVAGPQRMIRWAYILGRYVGRIQGEFQKAMAAFKQEIEATGLSEVTKDMPKMPGRFDAVAEAKKLINPESPTAPAEPTASNPSSTAAPSTDTPETKYDAWQPK